MIQNAYINMIQKKYFMSFLKFLDRLFYFISIKLHKNLCSSVSSQSSTTMNQNVRQAFNLSKNRRLKKVSEKPDKSNNPYIAQSQHNNPNQNHALHNEIHNQHGSHPQKKQILANIVETVQSLDSLLNNFSGSQIDMKIKDELIILIKTENTRMQAQFQRETDKIKKSFEVHQQENKKRQSQHMQRIQRLEKFILQISKSHLKVNEQKEKNTATQSSLPHKSFRLHTIASSNTKQIPQNILQRKYQSVNPKVKVQKAESKIIHKSKILSTTPGKTKCIKLKSQKKFNHLNLKQKESSYQKSSQKQIKKNNRPENKQIVAKEKLGSISSNPSKSPYLQQLRGLNFMKKVSISKKNVQE